MVYQIEKPSLKFIIIIIIIITIIIIVFFFFCVPYKFLMYYFKIN